MLSRIFLLSFVFTVSFQVISGDPLDSSILCDGSKDSIYLPNDITGVIGITRSKNTTNGDCTFKSHPGDEFVAIKLDQFRLYRNETLTITEGVPKNNPPVVLTPPINYDYVLVKLIDATFSFKFQVHDETVQNLTFYQFDNFLNLTSDSDASISILPINSQELRLGLDNHDQAVHLQFGGAKLDSTGLQNHLVTPNIAREELKIKFSGKSPVAIKTSKVSSECSNKYNLGIDSVQNIIGPRLTSGSYRCVNLFTATNTSRGSHYEINVNELGANDSLTCDDSDTVATLNLKNQPALTRANNIALIYESQFNELATSNNLNVSVFHTTSGGYYVNSTLAFPKNSISNHVRFIIPANKAVECSEKLILSPGISLKVVSKGVLLGQFNDYAPPMISSENEMLLDFAGPDFSSLNNRFNIIEKNPNLTHIMTTQDMGTFSNLFSNSCLTLSSNSSKIATISSDRGRFCFTATSLVDSKSSVICSNESGILPRLVVDEANLNFTSGNQITAQIVPMTIPTLIKLDNKTAKLDLTSPGYPVSYPIGLPTQVNLLNSNQSYLLHIDALELRKEEKMYINNQLVVASSFEDLFVNSTNITIARPSKLGPNIDATQKKGYKISLVQYDKLMTLGAEQHSIILPKNITSVAIKKEAQVGKNIGFDLKTSAASLNGTVTVSDGPSITNKKIVIVKNSGLSTANTILFVLRAPASKVLPNDIKIDFNYKPCNASTGLLCDNKTRCVPFTSLCQGDSYCQDKSDLYFKCQNPKPVIIEGGYSGTAVFFLSLFMITLGVMCTLYGPSLYRTAEARFRSGSYSAFSSVE